VAADSNAIAAKANVNRATRDPKILPSDIEGFSCDFGRRIPPFALKPP
jgi:hypothetical protein